MKPKNEEYQNCDQHLLNYEEYAYEQNPEFNLSETYTEGRQILNMGYDDANPNIKEENIPHLSNFNQNDSLVS